MERAPQARAFWVATAAPDVPFCPAWGVGAMNVRVARSVLLRLGLFSSVESQRSSMRIAARFTRQVSSIASSRVMVPASAAATAR